MDADVDKLPGLKEDELIKLGTCAICGKKLIERSLDGSVSVTFYRLKIERAGFHIRNLERRAGLGMMLTDALARVMGPDEDLAKVIAGPKEIVVHEGCAHKVAHLAQFFAGD